jgi:hypothetical protein
MKQKLSFKDILKFFGMAIGTGAIGMFLGFGAGYVLAILMHNQGSGWGDLVGAIIGLFVFYPVGVALGQVIFKIRHYHGSLLLGIAGIVGGVFLTIVLNSLIHLNKNTALLLGTYFVLIPILGVAGYHMGRKFPKSP